jgi:hypothetical protein
VLVGAGAAKKVGSGEEGRKGAGGGGRSGKGEILVSVPSAFD